MLKNRRNPRANLLCVVNTAACIARYLGAAGDDFQDRLQWLYGVIEVRGDVVEERTSAPRPQQQRDFPDTSGWWLIHDAYMTSSVTT